MKLFNCCCPTKLHNAPKIVILLVGLDNAGKTSAVNGLTKREMRSVIPTVGFSVVNLKHRGYHVMIYDLGGGPQIREIWPKYFNDVHGVIFVIDASDTSRLEESRIVLEKLLKNDKIAAKPVLILANKQDKLNALDELDLTEKLNLESLVNLQKCPTRVEISSVGATAATSNRNKKRRQTIDQGLINGYRWLVGQIIKNYEVLNARVLYDCKKDKEEYDLRRQLWKEREMRREDTSETTITDFNSTNEDIHYDNINNYNGVETSSSENIICNGIKHEVVTEVHYSADLESTSYFSNRPSSVTSPIRDQLEEKGKKQRKKSFSAHSRRRNNKISPLTIGGGGNVDELNLMTRERTTIELKELFNGGEGTKQPRRPTTTRSLGRQGTAWDLDKPLDVINLFTSPDKVDKSTSIN